MQTYIAYIEKGGVKSYLRYDANAQPTFTTDVFYAFQFKYKSSAENAILLHDTSGKTCTLEIDYIY